MCVKMKVGHVCNIVMNGYYLPSLGLNEWLLVKFCCG